MRGLALVTLLAACSHDAYPRSNDPGVVVDRGKFEIRGADVTGSELFTVIDRPDGGHILLGESRAARGERKLHSRGRIVTDAAWRPLEALIDREGATLTLARQGDKLVINGTDVGSADLFAPPDLVSVLQPLCAAEVTGRKTLTMYPDAAIELTTSPLDAYTSVSVTGRARFELVCDKKKLVVVNGGGLVAVRKGYEKIARQMLDAIGPVR